MARRLDWDKANRRQQTARPMMTKRQRKFIKKLAAERGIPPSFPIYIDEAADEIQRLLAVPKPR